MRRAVFVGFVVAMLLTGVARLPAAVVPPLVGGALPPAPGTGLTVNRDGEPGLAAAPDGTLWATAFQLADPRGNGQDIWRSPDGGRSWQWVASPFNVPRSSPILGSDDADVAVASERNRAGQFNVYAASLWSNGGPSPLEIALAVSSDGGATWTVHPIAAELPLNDRPWLAADGPCRVYLNYHSTPTVINVVNVYDVCNPLANVTGLTLVPIASTRFPSLLVPLALGRRATYVTAGFGKLAVDTSARSPYRHRIYIPIMDCPDLTLLQELGRGVRQDNACPAGHASAPFVLVGTGGETRWQLRRTSTTSRHTVPVWPATIATDQRGRVYLAWHDDHDAWLQRSVDGGATWFPQVRLNPPTATAVYPTVAATGDGIVEVAWFGADRTGDANDPARMGPPGSPGAARWQLLWSRSTDRGATFAPPTIVDGLVHTGVLCTRGTNCAIPNSRTLYDDFGLVFVPGTTRPVVVYTSDQPGGTFANDAIRWATE